LHTASLQEEGALISAPKSATQSDANNDPSNALSTTEVLMASPVTVQTSGQDKIIAGEDATKTATYLRDITPAASVNLNTSQGAHFSENSATQSTINAFVNASTAGGAPSATVSPSTSSVSNTQKIDNETTLSSFTPTTSIQPTINASVSFQINASAASTPTTTNETITPPSTTVTIYFHHLPSKNFLKYMIF